MFLSKIVPPIYACSLLFGLQWRWKNIAHDFLICDVLQRNVRCFCPLTVICAISFFLPLNILCNVLGFRIVLWNNPHHRTIGLFL